jgi:DNA gyrase/topoisomerase IV subunit B
LELIGENMSPKKIYDENSIEVLEFPDDVRKRPGMYIGGTTTEGMHHIYKEILDNSVDEAIAGHCSKIIITNEGDGVLSVMDDGRGIPTGINKAKGVSALELVFTVLHAGGKFHNEGDDSGYKTCFTGDTKIRLLDGTTRSFKWLSENYADREFRVISCLPDGTVIPAKARNPHKTKEVTKLAVVTLDNGKKARCTLDHRWMLRDGTYTEAQHLKPNDSLMPFYWKRDKQGHLLFQSNNERLTANVNNHKVVNVEIITLETPEAVYDIQVPGPNNFALEAGVFAHNSGGLHGVGASVTNAVSEFLQVYVKRDKNVWFQEYKQGYKQNDVKKIKKCPVDFIGKSGTYVRFKPDKNVFKHIDIEWDYDRIIRRCREVAFLVPGLEINVQGWEDQEDNPNVTFKYENGLHDYIQYQMKNKKSLVDNVDLNFTLDEVGCAAQVVFTYEEGYDEHISSFANNIPTLEGGVHLNAFTNALLKCIVEIGEKEKITKDFGGKVRRSDIQEGLHAVILVRLQQPEFEGQTKTKLGNPEIRTPLEEQFSTQIRKTFERKRKEDGKTIAKKILQTVIARENARKAKELTRKKGGLEHFTLKGKLADCESKDPKECELFLVEGDCFHKDTVIITDQGPKKISEIQNGDMIYTANHRFKPATVRKPKVKKKKCRITVQGKAFVCSEDHLWLVMRCDSEIAEWVPAKDLKPDDLVVKTIFD